MFLRGEEAAVVVDAVHLKNGSKKTLITKSMHRGTGEGYVPLRSGMTQP